MRRSERHHLKENALAVFVGRLQHRMENWGASIEIGAGVGVVVLLLVGGYAWWSVRADATAGALLADALGFADVPVVPSEADAPAGEPPAGQPPGSYPTVAAKMSASLPKLLEAADAYPGTPAGITARYRAAGALAALGRHDEAAAQYRQVIDRDGEGLYGRMATLGLASAQMALGAHEEAIALLDPSASAGDDAALPVDGVLMQLGRAYRLAGRAGDARAAFQRVVDEFPTSLYFPNARRALQALESGGRESAP